MVIDHQDFDALAFLTVDLLGVIENTGLVQIGVTLWGCGQ